MNKWTLRKLELSDADSLASVEASIFRDAWSAQKFQELLPQKHFIALGIFAGLELCGYVTGYNIDGEVEIVNVAVQEQKRGAGLGTILLQGLQSLDCGRKVERIVLEVRSGNAPARALYAKTGFVHVGLRKGYYTEPREDAIVLEWVKPCHA